MPGPLRGLELVCRTAVPRCTEDDEPQSRGAQPQPSPPLERPPAVSRDPHPSRAPALRRGASLGGLAGRRADETRTPPPPAPPQVLPAPSPSPRQCTHKLGLLPPSSSSTAGGGGVGLGCPPRNRINAPKISGQRRASRWETMPSFQPCPQRQPAVCGRSHPRSPSLAEGDEGDRTKIPRF